MAGRPTLYDKAIVEEILDRLSHGETLKAICESDERYPAAPTIRKWVMEDREGIAALYARGKELQIEAWADGIIEIADDGRNDWMTIRRGGVDVEVPNREVLERSRLRVDTRKWLACKIMPKKFGDKVVQEVTGKDGGPILYGWGDSPPKI